MKFPKIELNDSDRLWLSEIHSLFNIQEEISSRLLKVKLLNKLAVDFDPTKIDRRLLRNQTDITLLGILYVDPKTDFVQKCESFINAVRDMLIEDPDTTDIDAEHITIATDIPSDEIKRILEKLGDLGHFWSSLGTSSDGAVSFGVDDDIVFDNYLKFNGLTDLLERFFIKYSPSSPEHFGKPLFSQEKRSEVMYNPIFHSRIKQVDRKLCFVLMPFTEDWSNRVYNELIKTGVENLGIQCLRADNLTGQIVIEDIWTKISQSAFIIADVTTRNPNVMYELGIVHTIGRPAILLIQNIEDVPFDFSHLRHFVYQDNTEGFRVLGEKLPKIIKEIYRDYYSIELDLVTTTGNT